MTGDMADRIARAVLYEGYILYPYRPSTKNRQRWTIGGLYPAGWSAASGGTDAAELQAEVLAAGGPDAFIDVKVRFLHLVARTVGELDEPVGRLPDGLDLPFREVERLRVGDAWHHAWQEAEEREVDVPAGRLDLLAAFPKEERFAFPGRRDREPLVDPDGETVGFIRRESRAVEGAVVVSARPIGDGLHRIAVRAGNRTPIDAAAGRPDALERSLIAAHVVLRIRGGEFVSLLEPPDALRDLVAGCRNAGVWPVLVGEGTEKDTMLASPIILYDYPQVAPESPGDLFDATEIDEILSLRIRAMTDDEKVQMAAVDERARALLDRTESLGPGDLIALHGTLRGVRPAAGGGER